MSLSILQNANSIIVRCLCNSKYAFSMDGHSKHCLFLMLVCKAWNIELKKKKKYSLEPSLSCTKGWLCIYFYYVCLPLHIRTHCSGNRRQTGYWLSIYTCICMQARSYDYDSECQKAENHFMLRQRKLSKHRPLFYKQYTYIWVIFMLLNITLPNYVNRFLVCDAAVSLSILLKLTNSGRV